MRTECLLLAKPSGLGYESIDECINACEEITKSEAYKKQCTYKNACLN